MSHRNIGLSKNVLAASLAVVLSTMLSACGGGGGGNTRPTQTPPVVIPPTNPTTPPSTPPPTNPGSDNGGTNPGGSGNTPPSNGGTGNGSDGNGGSTPPSNGGGNDGGSTPPGNGGTGDGSGGDGGSTPPSNGGGDGSGGGTTTPPPPPPWNSWSQAPLPTGVDTSSLTSISSAIGADAAHTQGYTGANVTIGELDTGTNVHLPNLQGKNIVVYDFYGVAINGTGTVLSNNEGPAALDPNLGIFPDVGSTCNANCDGHGSIVAQELIGSPSLYFQGGVAPDAALAVAQVTDSSGTISWNGALAAFQQLTNNGVHLFNNSWASATTGTPIPAPDPSYTVFHDLVNNHNDVFVWASGNSGMTQPSAQVLMPENDATLQKGWVGVTGADFNPTTQKYDTLNMYANACGNAAGWCLTAPMTVSTLYGGFQSTDAPPASPASDMQTAVGTSMATPMVTGTVALVSSAFPWMSNDNLTTTVLSTATYMDDGSNVATPFNATFGWGLVNAGKAVKGPAMFYFNDFDANVPSGSYTFSNDISGPKGLIKDGVGTLRLSGNNTYVGDTTVNAGTLGVDGAISGNVAINASGTVSGRGGSMGMVTNNGTISTAEGSLTIHGNYTEALNGSSQFITYLGNMLTVDGTASLNGLVTLGGSAPGYTPPSDTTILTAGSVVGQWQAWNNPGTVFQAFVIHYTPTSAVLEESTITPMSVASLNVTPSAHAAAVQTTHLFNIADTLATQAQNGQTLSGLQNSYLTNMGQIQSINTMESARSSLASLSGEMYGQYPALLLQSQMWQSRMTEQRLDRVGFNLEEGGVWASVNNLDGHSTPSGWDASRSNINVLSVGVDHSFNNTLWVGGYVNTSHTNASFDNLGGQLKSDQSGLGVYGKWKMNAWYLEGLVQYQKGSGDTTRTLFLGNTYLSTSAHPHVQSWSSKLESGYAWNASKGWMLTPFVALTDTHAQVSHFSDVGGDGLGLDVSGRAVAQTSVQGGLKVHYQFDSRWSMEAYGLHEYAFSMRDKTQYASYIIDPSVRFVLDNPTYGRNSNQFGLHATGEVANHHFLTVAVDRRTGQNNHLTAVSLNYKYTW